MTENVKKYILKNEELKKKKQRILELQNDPNVKEYIDLINELNFEDKRAREIITIKDNDVNKILFKYGYYNVSKCGKYPLNTLIYRDLETGFYYRCSSIGDYQKMDAFCFENIGEKIEFENRHFEYEQLKKYFFEELEYNQQENITGELLENNKRLIKGK